LAEPVAIDQGRTFDGPRMSGPWDAQSASIEAALDALKKGRYQMTKIG
jgi:hypothetical protein